MSFTTLRVTEAGVVLFDQHARRLGDRAALAAFAQEASPGVYRAFRDAGGVRFTMREETALRDGMPVRVLRSPLAPDAGLLEKPAPPGPYAAVRAAGIATLLTGPDDQELWESCAAAILAWEHGRVIAPPRDRPRVRSTAEEALDAAGLLHRAPIPVAAPSLLLVNALGSAIPAGRTFPAEVRAGLLARIQATARR